MRRILALMMVVAVSGCTLDQQGAPPLAGPSGLGLSLAVTATPDILPQDGSSQSVIQVVATDDANEPVVGLALKTEAVLRVAVGQPCPAGLLLTSPGECHAGAVTITTDGEGKASAVFSAPGFLGADAVATVRVTPMGSNYGNSQPRFALIRLSVL